MMSEKLGPSSEPRSGDLSPGDSHYYNTEDYYVNEPLMGEDEIENVDQALKFYLDPYCNDFRPTLRRVMGSSATEGDFAQEISQNLRLWGLVREGDGHYEDAVALAIKVLESERDELIRNETIKASILLLDRKLEVVSETDSSDERIAKISQLLSSQDLLECLDEATNQLWRNEDQSLKEELELVMSRTIDRLMERVDELDDPDFQSDRQMYTDSKGLFKVIFHRGNSKQREWVQDYLGKVRFNHENHPMVKNQVLFELLDSDFYTKHYAEEIIREIAAAHAGIPSESFQDYLEAWKKGGSDKVFSIILNLEQAMALESDRSGSVETLTRDFGIYDFVRYPRDVLMWQLDHAGQKNLQYGIILFPREDYNEAFRKQDILSNIFRQMNYESRWGGCIVIEAGSKLEAIRRLNKIRTEHGSASFSIIGGHGTENSIALGDNFDKGGEITTDDISKMMAISSAKRDLSVSVAKPPLLKSGSPVLLFSCSTGAERGIGQKISQMTRGKVMAPNAPTSAKTLNFIPPSEAGGLPSFEIEYHDEGVAMEYQFGQKMEKLPPNELI